MKLFSKGLELNLSSPVVMGILNVTPDSFSDGGAFNAFEKACEHAKYIIDSGASIIDIGGESTRPGAQAVSLEEELARVIPLVDHIVNKYPDIWISVDTNKPEVMQQAVEHGAHMINDVYALQKANALETIANLNVPVCLMHMKGNPENMQLAPDYQNIVSEVIAFFNDRVTACLDAGINRNNIILDVGFGFGKTLEHNYQLLANLEQFADFELPMLIGVSRKSMIGNLLERDVNQRLAGSLACAMIGLEKKVNILRVHDVAETIDTVKIYNASRLYAMQ